MRGLSVHQAPPFQIIALYFSTACVFWFLSSLLELFLFFKRELNLPLPVHSHVVGFALMTMLGALFQMLPVVAGAVMPEPLKKAIPIHLALLLSSLLFLGGFLLKNETLLLFGATLLMLSIISAPYRLPLSILYIIYALTTVYLLLKSKRRVLEYTPKFWLLGMGLLLLASIFFALGEFLAFLVSFVLFFSSIILGMMQRIVPFLVWFHLSGFGLKDAPLMFEIIPPRRQAITFYSFLILCLSIPFALISTDFLIVSIILHLFTALVLLFNVLGGIGIYLKYVRQGL